MNKQEMVEILDNNVCVVICKEGDGRDHRFLCSRDKSRNEGLSQWYEHNHKRDEGEDEFEVWEFRDNNWSTIKVKDVYRILVIS